MKMFSDCSGECCVCFVGDHGCLAGHGDDYFHLANKDEIIERIKAGKYPHYHDYMKNILRDEYGYDYDYNTELKNIKSVSLNVDNEEKAKNFFDIINRNHSIFAGISPTYDKKDLSDFLVFLYENRNKIIELLNQ